jgi:hypothetical protein
MGISTKYRDRGKETSGNGDGEKDVCGLEYLLALRFY